MTVKKISAAAMSEVDVTHISLVKRGANRQPIKLYKSEEGRPTMNVNKTTQSTLDLAQIGALAIKSEQGLTPVLVAATVNAGDGERIAELLKGVDGLVVGTVQKDEANGCDIISLNDGSFDEKNCIVYKHDDNIAFIVANVQQTTKKMEFWANSTSFKENIQKTSFFPNMREACYTLMDTLANVLYEGDDAEVVTKAEAEVGAFKEYLGTLLQALPVKVMKSLEKIDFKKPEAEDEQTTVDAGTEAGAEVAAKSEDGKDGGEGAEVVDNKDDAKEEPKEDAAKTEGAEPEVAAKSDDTPAWALELAKTMTSKLEGIESRLGEVEAQAAATAKKAEEAAEQVGQSRSLVEKAEGILSAARGSVVAGPEVENLAEDEDYIPDQARDHDLIEAGIERA